MTRKLIAVLLSVALLAMGWLGLSGLLLPVAFVPLLWLSAEAENSRRGWWQTFRWALLTFVGWNVATVWWIWNATPIGPVAATLFSTFWNMLAFMTYHTVVKKAPKALAYTLFVAIWIATEYGISRFDPEKHTFENFFFSSSALGNVYGENSWGVSQEGKLIFGTNHGLVVISPTEIINHSTDTPEVAFTTLRIDGISVRTGDADSPLDRSLIYTNELKLKHFQNSFVIDFSIFDYSADNSTKYTYRLDNYDKEWSAPSSLNFAAYKNLSPGSYLLRVKACNRVGHWNDEEAVLKIVIVPPFWKTTWAFLIYALLIGAILYFAFRLMQNFNTLRNRIEVEKQLTEYKLVFFTNISMTIFIS